MTLSLRYRVLLTLVPLLVLLAALGAAALVLLYHLGGRIDAILRENYESVIAMERLNEALERIDSSFQFALAGREDKARRQYEANWGPYRNALELEQNNITLPGEAELVEQLTALTERYRREGDVFYAPRTEASERRTAYFGGTGRPGLLQLFEEIKDVSQHILRINQENMEEASRDARRTARLSLVGFGAGLGAVALLALLLGVRTIRTILQPIQAMTRSAQAIGAGNLDQVVPYTSPDELGQLAQAFNTMARQLRDLRQSQYSQLLRAQRTAQATIDSFPVPVLVVDPAGCVELANPAARKLLGVVPRGAQGPGFGVPWQPPEALRQPLARALQAQEPYLPEGFDRTIVLRVEGQEQFFLPRLLPIRDPYGNSLGAAVLLLDVTRFRLLDEVKSNLVGTVSHELKTPLTSVRLAVHVLLEEAVGPLTPKQTELLMDARDNAERLLDRLNHLLDLTRLEQGGSNLDLRPEPAEGLLRAAADDVRSRAEEKHVALTVEAPPDLPPVAADAGRLAHALGNLLENALKYTGPGGKITLGAAAANGQVVLSVADTGSGIPPEHLPHVFEKFFRVPGQSRGEGTGLGLAIVKEIAQAHGGDVSCDSRPGEGTVFRLWLPAWKGGAGKGRE
jgi:signal transduction histidine kinase/HAMP domain-containing protein